MPRRPQTDCAHPGCTTPVDHGRCPTHREQHRNDTSPRVDYGPEWPGISKRHLRCHPLCVRCGSPATETDHIIPFRCFTSRHVAHHHTNLQSLCSPCHKRKTATEDSTFAANARAHTPQAAALRRVARQAWAATHPPQGGP